MPSESPSAEVDAARWYQEEVQPHAATLRSWLLRRFPAVRDVDDVVQESLMRVWLARARGPIRSGKAFLFKVARHQAIDLSRRDKISPVVAVRDLTSLPVLEDRPGAAGSVSGRDKVRLLAQAIDALPSRCRMIVILRKLKGLSQKETAAQLGVAEKTVEAQLARGIRRCEAWLRKRGVDQYYSDESA